MRAFAAVLISTFCFLPSAFAQDVATILCYHEVDDAVTHTTTPRASATENSEAEQLRYTATRSHFAEQLDYLANNDYHVIPMGELVEYLSGEKSELPPRAVVITVDDGWACVVSNMLPELEKREMPFTVFVYPKIVGRGSHAVTWKDVTTLAGDPLVTIGSHSFTHPFLTKSQDLDHELGDSKTTLEKATGKRVTFLAYPFGDYDENVSDLARAYGYVAAVTTERQPVTRTTSPMAMGRYLIHNDTTLDEFKTFLPR